MNLNVEKTKVCVCLVALNDQTKYAYLILASNEHFITTLLYPYNRILVLYIVVSSSIGRSVLSVGRSVYIVYGK